MRPRVWSVVVAAAVAIVFLLFAARRPAPKLYPGDRMETRTCRWCEGSGVERGEHQTELGPVKAGGPCVGCRGAKKLRVVIPGPNHPAWVKGTVVDPALAGPAPGTSAGRFTAPSGALKGARLDFERNSKHFETTVGLTGRFKILLEPGHYRVRITYKDYKPYEGELDVFAPKEPIWEEYARLVTPDEQAPYVFQLTR